MNVKTQLVAIVLFLACTLSHAYKPELGEAPAAMDRLEYVDGTPVDLLALRGSPTVLYFGADWCVPCVERGRPATMAAASKYGPMGLKVIFVSMDDNKFRASKVEEENRLGMRIAMARMEICPPHKCPSGSPDLGAFGRIYYFPTAFVLDANGVVRARMSFGQGVAGGLDAAVREVMQAAGMLAK